MQGSFLSLTGNSLTLDRSGKKTIHAVDPDAVVTLNGNPATLADLVAGDKVTLNGDPATKVDATRAT